jgi:hypothetical protein
MEKDATQPFRNRLCDWSADANCRGVEFGLHNRGFLFSMFDFRVGESRYYSVLLPSTPWVCLFCKFQAFCMLHIKFVCVLGATFGCFCALDMVDSWGSDCSWYMLGPETMRLVFVLITAAGECIDLFLCRKHFCWMIRRKQWKAMAMLLLEYAA